MWHGADWKQTKQIQRPTQSSGENQMFSLAEFPFQSSNFEKWRNALASIITNDKICTWN